MNRNYLLYLIVLLIGLYSLDFLVQFQVITFYEYLFLWVGLSSVFLILYTLRFRRKENLTSIEYIKLIVALLLPFVQMIGYLGYSWEDESLMLVPIIYFILALFVYVFDRIIQKLWLMNRKYVTVLIIQALISIVCIAYAFVQQTLAKEAERNAVQMRMEGEIRSTELQKRVTELSKELEELKSSQGIK